MNGSSIERLRGLLDLVAATSLIAGSIILVVISVRAYRNGGGATNDPNAAPLPAEPLDISRLNRLGRTGAPVVLVEYSDFQCPACAQFARETLPSIRSEFVDTGKLAIAFVNAPNPVVHPLAYAAAEVGVCAGSQGRFWDMHDRIFKHEGALSHAFLDQLAGDMALDRARYDGCMQNEAENIVRRDSGEAAQILITATPTIFLGNPQTDGRVRVTRRLIGAAPPDALKTAIEALLR